MSNISLRFRIVDDIENISKLNRDGLDLEGDPEGFFEIQGERFSYGYFHENEIEMGEEGEYLIAVWFELFLKAAIALNSHDYVAIKDVDSINRWVQIEKVQQDNVSLKIISTDMPKESVITTQRFDDRKERPSELIVAISCFRKEVIFSARLYLEQLVAINRHFMATRRYLYLKGLVEETETLGVG